MRTLLIGILAIVLAIACNKRQTAEPTPFAQQTPFATPTEAADALVDAASVDDVRKLLAILGPSAKDLIASADPVQDKSRASAFAAKAREKKSIEVAPDDPSRATLVVGRDDWPLPIPLVRIDDKWYFDSEAGREEILARRIGANELDVLAILRRYVDAQREYASKTHGDPHVNQYAQKVVSSPGKQDGLAWRAPDGTWAGPLGPTAAQAIEQGYREKEPYHGYFFKTLHGQGPSARLGTLDYVVDGAMIGGFGMVAWPADHGVTGIQTFIVSYDGVVYQKDLGPGTGTIAPAMDRYDPDASWRRADEEAAGGT